MGVEPTLPCGKHDFQSCAFGHSAISPVIKRTLGGSFRTPATSAVKQSLPSLTRCLKGPTRSLRRAPWGKARRRSHVCYLVFCGEERVGVEPTLPCGKPDFESGAFGHSAISPFGRQTYAAYAAEGQAPGDPIERRGKSSWANFPPRATLPPVFNRSPKEFEK